MERVASYRRCDEARNVPELIGRDSCRHMGGRTHGGGVISGMPESTAHAISRAGSGEGFSGWKRAGISERMHARAAGIAPAQERARLMSRGVADPPEGNGAARILME
jgi:hypothetical protein